jgi:hypothetical protein
MNATLTTERKNYRPGEDIRGTVTWSLPHLPGSAAVRLFWQTRGKGDRDAATVEVQSFALPQAQESRDFSFRAPDFPYSFSGKLISLVWGLELVLDPDGSQTVEIIISPDGAEIVLPSDGTASLADSKKQKFPWMSVK